MNTVAEPRSPTEDGPENLDEAAQLHAQLAQSRIAIGELKHRTKNLLSLIQSIANQTLRGTVTLPYARESLDQRLAAMGRAVDVLLRTDWTETPLRDLVIGALAHRESFAGRFNVEGPPVAIGPNAALTLTMALHELETNAIKYGALAQDGGSIDLSWTSDGESVALLWRERGCIGVVAPTRSGFGTKLICDIPAKRFGGVSRLDWAEDGVTWTFSAKTAKLLT